MIPFFPRQIATKAIYIYVIALATVSALYFRYAMPVWRMGLGLMFVVGFFLLTSTWSQEWAKAPEKQFAGRLFGWAFGLRIIWVIASYFFYNEVLGNPFEYSAADSMGYHEEAEWLASEPWSMAMAYYFGPYATGISDVGYPLYLTVIYKIFGPYVLPPRFIKCLLSAWMCVLVYKLSARTFGESVGRMAGIMCCLMPNFIIYCGYHLKETETIFLEVAFLERTDFIMRSRKYNLWNILLPLLLAGSLFFFRTALGAVAVFAFVSGIVFINTPLMKKGGRRERLTQK